MDYHSDRFEDGSLMVYKGDKLLALVPANRVESDLHSHQGLSYGGLILGRKEKLNVALELFGEVLKFLHKEGIERLHIKLVPPMYCKVPSDELEYLLFIAEATLTRVDVSSVIENPAPLKIQSNRTEGVKKAERNQLEIREEHEFKAFWNEILAPNLERRHQAKPVHTLEEIELLAARFPKHIQQFNVYKQGRIVAGATIFETEINCHVQYISGNEEKQQLGSLDYLFDYLITQRYANKKFFDFGISNENHGKNLNGGLLYWKETFGARSVAKKFYTVQTSHFSKLDDVFL